MPVPLDQQYQSSIPLHRIRFYDHTPSPITALAFSPQPLPPARDPASKGKAKEDAQLNGRIKGSKSKEEFGALVLARDNGQVEIWQYLRGDSEGSYGNWVLEKTLPPTLTHPTISLMSLVVRDPLNFHMKPYVVPKLEDLRLFTAGSDSSDLTERCLLTGKILQAYAIPSPPIWSMAVSPTHSLLCLSTTSPTLHFLSIPPPLSPGSFTQLEPAPTHLLRSDTLPARARTVSIAWGVPKLIDNQGSWEWRDSYLITGNSDSSFRKWERPAPGDESKGPGLGRVSMVNRSIVEKITRHYKGGKKNAMIGHKGTIVWGVGVLPDHTVVTSDSLGGVTFWDGKTMAQKQHFDAHKADGMSLVVGPGGRSVFTAGPDQRICQFTLVPSSGTSQWMLTATKRIHSHDIRALATFPAYLPLPSSHPLSPPAVNPAFAPVLASGGWDMSLAISVAGAPDPSIGSLRDPLGKERHVKSNFEEGAFRRQSYLGGGRSSGRIGVAREARLVLGRKDRSIGVWRILDGEQGWEKVLEMELRLRTSLVSSAISQDGKWLAVSDLYETKLFHLDPSSTSPKALHPTRIRSFLDSLSTSSHLGHLSISTLGSGSSSLLFTPDSQRLVMGTTTSAQVIIVELPDFEDGDRDVTVLKCFKREETVIGGRQVVGGRQRTQKTRKTEKQAMDVDGEEFENGDEEMDKEDEDHESTDDDDDEEEVKKHAPWVACIAASDDGQWLAVSDLAGRVGVYNLDTLQIHTSLPTLPFSPLALIFPPSQPSLLLILYPTQNLQFYHLENRRLLPPTQQLVTLNSALRAQSSPAESVVFEPTRSSSRSARVVVWSSDWMCTARLDLEQIAKGGKGAGSLLNGVGPGTPRSTRRKRAKEAREQLEAVSASPAGSVARSLSESGSVSATVSASASVNGSAARLSGSPVHSGPVSSNDPDFYKITNQFKGVAAALWLGEGEMCVVEKPMVDFVGELPPAFWSGGFGRS